MMPTVRCGPPAGALFGHVLKSLFALACIFLLWGCGEAARHPPLPPGSVVLAIGDSVTHGTGAAQGEDYPARLAALSGWVIRNHGIPGDTSAGVWRRIDKSLDEVRPVLVILEIGGNDFLRRVSPAETKENIRAVIRRVRQSGIPVVLVATPSFSPLGAAFGRLPDAPLYAELAEEEKVSLVPAIFGLVLSDRALKSDAIHPNGAGYLKLAEGIAGELRTAGFLQ